MKEITTRRFNFCFDQDSKYQSKIRPLNYLSHWSLDERVLNKLKGTGFDTLRGFSNHLCVNLPLINVLINRYDADTRSFKFGSAENPFNIAFGLEDVLYLTGLPIDGKAVTGVDPKDKVSVCLRYLGKHEEYGTGIRSHISLTWLKENFMTLEVDDEDLSKEELAYHVRAYVLYAIGCTFAPSQNLMVSPVFLPLLENVDDIGSYAWGAALLANIHDSMEKPTSYSIGFYFPLMIFAYIRFPGLLSVFELDRAVINVFPLVVSWSHVLDLVMRQQFKNHNEVNLETFFARLKEEGTGEEQVKWKPYGELPSNFLPQHLRKQVVLSKSRTILICFERAVYHRPDKCQRQLGLAGHILKEELIEIKTISRKGRKGRNGKDWSKKGKYLDYVSEWDKRFDLLIDRDANAVLEQAKASYHQINVLVEENAAPDQAKASDYQIGVLVEANAAPDQAKASGHQINVHVGENAALDQDKTSDHRIDVLVEANPSLNQDNASDHQIDVLLEANAALGQASDHLMDVLLEANGALDQAIASDHTYRVENVASVAEAGSVNIVEDVASLEETVVLQDNQDPEKDVAPVVSEAGSVNDVADLEETVVLQDNQDPENEEVRSAEASLIAELRKENEKLKEDARRAEASLVAKLRNENEKIKEDARRAETSLTAELRKENEKLKEEIELYRKKFPDHVIRISRIEESLADLLENRVSNSRADNVDVASVDHQSPGDSSSSRVRDSSEIRSCDPQIEANNVKRQRVSPSNTTAGVVDRANPPLILYVDSDSDSDLSITDSFMDALVGSS